ncbi:family 16 glycosylhydrolase [Flavobacteriaceae bacterium]|nr:family 16 glycosylhydrolase [Flavobacteriaceae bacterium]MDA9254158.1 family 16 glycosylhydrolase [Flavobacteriaceae bacterium]MDA9353906.1 family 16 glycosylhydrolase [Flavobacteriaceae bacterium]MDB4064237.1 family 16 glycosylhydrolase [Flavobacteriaceae bacterium]MDB4207230.1 family 16 glycosylhydrolase [Flavobacteriaceae bacterium]
MRIQYIIYSLLVLSTSVSFSQQTPINFENTSHSFIGFGNSSYAFNTDPQDTTNNVGEFNNDGSSANQGFYIDLNRSIDLDEEKNLSLSFYSYDTNSHSITIKLENGENPDVEVTQTISGSSQNNWTALSFDFSNATYTSNGTSIDATGTYNRLTIFIDLGVNTSGTYLIDTINDGSEVTDPNEIDIIYTDLVWADEFDTNGAIDAAKWHHQTQLPQGGSWYNGEVQHYTNRIENSSVNNGFLDITAIKENFTDQGQTKQYTSARLNSKFAFTYGRVDVRAKLPFGDGTWPAIWTLGKNINEDGGYWDNQYGTVGWPACGELDIMEHGLHPTNQVSVAIHTPSSYGSTVNTSIQPLADVANDFHVYSMNWSPDQITFLIDGVGFYTYNPAVKNDDTWPFYLEQYLLLNIAMGGNGGAIDSNFSQSSMVIDYVRVYQNTTASTEDVFANKFSVYPNPSSDVLNIRTNEPIDKVELYNTIGQLIVAKKTTNINISSINIGVYILKIYSGKRIVTKKVMIN